MLLHLDNISYSSVREGKGGNIVNIFNKINIVKIFKIFNIVNKINGVKIFNVVNDVNKSTWTTSLIQVSGNARETRRRRAARTLKATRRSPIGRS